MASRNKTDVELVIKARNDSTKAFKDILGNIKGLENQLKILGKQSNLVSSFKEAEAEAGRLKTQIDLLASAQTKLNKKIGSEKKGTDSYKETRKELTKVNKELRSVTASYNRSQKAIDTYANRAEAAGTSIDKLVKKESKLTDEITDKRRLLAFEQEKKARVEASKVAQKSLQERLKAFKEEKVARQSLEAEQLKSAAVEKKTTSEIYAEKRKAWAEEKKVRAEQQAIARKNIQERLKLYKQEKAATSAASNLSKFRAEAAKLAVAYRNAGGSLAKWRVIVKSSRGDVDRLTVAVNKHTAAKHKEIETQQRQLAKGKQALSYYQRLRSQVIGLVGAYAGLHGVSRSIGSVFDTQNQLIAAQNRFAVGFGGDRGAAADELRFVRSAAEELKLPVEALIEDYSKFVAASRELNFTQSQLREIFLGVAKASVVNKLSVADTKGVYRALTQIMSKNQVMAEELRQQLGDRLPGAIAIMAKAAGKSTAELTKMMEQGRLSGDILIKFGRELDNVYGSQVSAALESPRAKLNDFLNVLFDIRDEVAKSGFIDELTDQLGEIAEELKTEDVKNGLIGIAKAIGSIAKFLVVLAKNWKIVGTIIGTILGLKIIKFVQGVIVTFGALGASSVAVAAKMSKLTGAFSKFGGLLARVIPFLIRFAGPVGLMASLVFSLVDFTGTTQAATKAGGEYEKFLQKYGKSAKNAADSQKDLNKAIKESELKRLDKDYDAEGLKTGIQSAKDELDKLNKDLAKGGTTVSFGSLGDSLFQPIDTKETEDRIQLLADYIELATSRLEQYEVVRERLIATGSRGDEPYELAEFDAERLAAIKKTTAFIEQARKRQDKLESKSLDDQLGLVKNSNALRLKENLLNQKEIQKQVSEHQKKIIDIEQKASGINGISTGGADRQISEQTTKIAALNDQLDQEIIASSLLYKELSINTAKTIDEFTNASLSSLREYISETQDLEGSVDPAVVGQKITAIRSQLESALVGADGATATSIAAGLRQIDAAYEKFTRGVADKNAKAIKAILTKGLSEIRRISTESQALQGSVDVQSIESEFARMFADLEARPGEVARATLQTLRVEYAQFFNQLLGENLQQLQAEIDQSVGQSLEKRLATIRQGYANLRNDFGGKASTADVAALDTTQQQDMQRAGFEAINQLLAQRDQLEFDIEVKRRQGLLTDLEANNQVLMLNEQYRILLMADAELALSNGMNHVAQGATNAANSMQTLNEVQTEMATTINKDLVSGLAGAFDQYVSGAMSAKDAFRQFASDFLRQMAMMILQQKILNSIGGGGLGGAVASVLHDGGIAGSSGTTRSVPSWMFNVAPRFHGGGVVGLASNEVPAVLEKGEGVFTKEQMASMGQKQGANVRIVNSIEPGFVTDSMSGSEGEQVILNHIRRNSYGIRKMIGG